MKILLCVINYPLTTRTPHHGVGIYPPLGTACVASVLRSAGHTVLIEDDCVVTDNHIRETIDSFSPDMVGFYTYTVTINRCYSWAQWIKDRRKGTAIVFGGPHATHLPLEVMKHDSVDIVVKGEAENSMREIADALSSGKPLDAIKGICFRSGGGIVSNDPEPPLKDLDSVPLPAYDLLKLDRYRSTITRRCSRKRCASVVTSRGCCYQCTFCSQTFEPGLRQRSPENVVKEIELLVHRYGIGEISFLDDTFGLDQEWVFRLCDLIESRKLSFVWNCNCRADQASKPFFQAMRKAGCRSVFIGVESASQEMLDSMNKRTTVAQIENAVALAKTILGHAICGFVFGMPGDTVERARRTISFAKKLNPDYAIFAVATALPGSHLYKEAVQKGLLRPERADWDTFFMSLSPFLPYVQMSAITKHELTQLVKRAYREYYFRPSYILGRLPQLPFIVAGDAGLFLQGVCSFFEYQLKKIGTLFPER